MKLNFSFQNSLRSQKNCLNFHFLFRSCLKTLKSSIDNIKPYVKTELTRQRIEGTLNTADFAEDKTLKVC